MNEESKVARLKWDFFGLIALIVCGLFSYGEMTYFILGRTAEANLTKAEEITVRSGRFGARTSQKLSLEYAFVEADGTRRTGRDTVDLDWAFPADKKVAVRYTPGNDGKSRLAGGFEWLWLVAFGIAMVVWIYFIIRFILHVRAETRD